MQGSCYNYIQVQRHIMTSADWPAVGQYVDFKDYEHAWGVGLVLFKNDHYIKIRNQGWGQRYDESIPLTEDIFSTAHAKIQPFRSIIRGYTGTRKSLSIRDHWKYTREDHQARLKKLQDFSTNLKEKSREELVQYLRGQHYFYIDFLMGNIYPSLDDLNKVYEYFTQHLQLLKDFLQHILKKGIANSSINAAVKRKESVVWEETYEQCYYELVDAMYSIAGMQERLTAFFLRQNEQLVKEVVGVYEKHEYYISTQIQNLRIFQLIMQLIEQVHKAYNQYDEQSLKLPFAFHFSLFQLFQIIEPVFLLQSLKEKGGQIFSLLFKVVSKAIQHVQPNDMKQVQIDKEIQHILHYSRQMAARYHREEAVGRWPEETRMRVCMLFLSCDKLEKKIRGISKVKEVAERTIKQQLGSFGVEALGQMISSLKVLEELFVQNEHIEIYKKSTELVNILYKYDIITVEELCFVWRSSINKHPLIVSQLFQFWIQMAYVLQYEDILRYAQAATLPSSALPQATSEYYLFFLDLVIAIVNNNVKSSGDNRKDDTPVQDSIDTMLQKMIGLAYQILIACKNQPYFTSLVSKYSTIVLESRFSKQLIEETYNRLIEQDHLRVCLEILKEVYVTHDRIDVHVPEDICMRLIECLRSPMIGTGEISSIFQILNIIISYSTRHSMTNKEFQILWEFFQGSKDEYRHLFYSWLLRTEQIHDNFTSHLNIGLTHGLKRFALTDIVSNPQYLNYGALTKKQLSIILQLFIEVNTFEGKIEKKKLMEGYRFLHRLKSLDLLNENTLWEIFQQCRSEEVVHYLVRYLIKFYFNFSPSLPTHLRKSRIDDIMERVMGNIREGHRGSNTRLVKHSLLLLRGIFEFVKDEDKSYYPSDAPFTYKVKVEVKYLSNLYRFDIGENQTISYLKIRVSERLKLKPGSFKMLVKEEDNLQELDYTFKNVTVVALRKCQVEIVEIGKDEQTVSRFVGSFINDDLENLLVDMLQNEKVATQVYHLIEELDLQLDKLNVLEKINTILQKHEGQGRTISNVEIYYHMLELKLFYKMLQKEEQAETLPVSPSFVRLLRCMKCPVLSDYQVTFLYKVVTVIIKAIRKVGKALHELQLPEHLFAVIYQLSKFLLKAKGVDHHIKEYSVKIIENANIIIQHFVGSSKIITFYVKQPVFADFITNIYLHNQIEQIRMIFTDKLGRYLLKSNPNEFANYFQPQVQDYLLELFVDNLYFKVKDKQLNSNEGVDNESAYDFCMTLAKIIAFIAPNRIDGTQIFKTIKNRSSSFFDECLNFIESVKLFSSKSFHWNYLLSGHFCLLLACFHHRPNLLEPDLLDFVMENCLALTGNVSEPLCRKMEHINQTFKFFNGLLISNRDVKFIRQTVQALGPCHHLELWRDNISWNISPKHEQKQSYRGLYNPGCICYMNSLLQQLFMIDDFRLALLNLETLQPTKAPQEKDPSEQQMENKTPGAEEELLSTQVAMLQGMKELFLKLQFSEENHINPTGFAKTLKTSEKKPMIKMNEQMDIDEFASILFEKLERGIRQRGQDNFVKRLFGGVYGHQIISLQCSHRSEREEQFFSMSLDVKDNITKSLESLVKTQLLDGGNKYHCQKCNKKVKAQKLQTVKQLPPYLILCLKRFEFDYDIDAKIKINDYCQFPQMLNLLPFSNQEILKNRGNMEDQSQERKPLPDDHFNFKLRGVVVHTGSADSGHYYSFIDNHNGNWFEFNDEDVIPFGLERLPEEAFGCRPSKYDLKTKNAYLLIYERIKKDQTKLDQKIILSKEQHKTFIERIVKKNRQIRKSELVFSDDYEHLVRRLQVNLHHISCPYDLQLSWYKYLLSFYFLVKARKQNMQYFLVFSQSIAKQITVSPLFCSLILTCFSSPRFIEEMFVFNMVRDKGRVLAEILTVAMVNHYQRAKPVSLEKDHLLSRVFDCLRAVFIVYGPIGELLTTLRKFLETVSDDENFQLIFKLIETYNFEQIILNSALSIGFEKKTKAECERYCKSKINDVDFLAPLAFYGKKMHQINMAEAWKICAMMLTLNNMYIEKPDNELKEERDFYINNIHYLKRCFSDPNIEAKMLNIIIESSSNKGIYYLYNTLKQLQFSTKMFPYIEKAIKDYESIKYRPFFLYLQHAINDKSLALEDQKKIVDLIERAYKVNEKYFLETDSIHQWILRFASMNQVFLDIIESKTIFIQEICEKIARNPFPSITDLNKKFKHHTNQKYLNRYIGILVSTQIRQYESNSIRMKADFEQIRNMTYTTSVEYMPPDENFKAGDRIQYYDLTLGRWKKAVIVEQHLGQFTIKKDSNDDARLQLWEDSEKIRKLPANRLMEAEFTPPESDISCSSESDESIHRR